MRDYQTKMLDMCFRSYEYHASCRLIVSQPFQLIFFVQHPHNCMTYNAPFRIIDISMYRDLVHYFVTRGFNSLYYQTNDFSFCKTIFHSINNTCIKITFLVEHINIVTFYIESSFSLCCDATRNQSIKCLEKESFKGILGGYKRHFQSRQASI